VHHNNGMALDLYPLVRDILTSRVYDVARETPLDPAPRLSARLDASVLLKREDLQPIFSFKIRGAYNRIVRLSAAERSKGVIAASAGNHALGVALSAQRLGLRAVIVMPCTTPDIKVDAVRTFGAEVASSAITTQRRSNMPRRSPPTCACRSCTRSMIRS
jgi:threonine dehydratase